ncbi:MAG: SDR family oxidoreductase [Prolixibacteraceae bacterium]|nr:SDR family oxidoreductase [Prolixibacteraceae bacterium]
MNSKVVIITGASSGIGEALARKYSQKGFNLVLAARSYEKLIELEKELQGNILCVKADVSIENDCKTIIDLAIDRFGKIDILINNAGISMRAAFSECDTSVLKRVMDVNFWGTVYCTKYALPHILQSSGSIVGIISIAGHIGLPGRTGYSASKYAMRGFLDALRTEYLDRKLHVLVAAPGFIASNIRENALTANGSSQGMTPRDEKSMMTAGQCAEIIYSAVKKRKREIVLTFFEGKLAVFLNKWLPRLVERVNFNMMLKEPGSPFGQRYTGS